MQLYTGRKLVPWYLFHIPTLSSLSSTWKLFEYRHLYLKCRRMLTIDHGIILTLWRQVLIGLPWSSNGKESAYSLGDQGSVSGTGRSPGEENGILKSRDITLLTKVSLVKAMIFPVVMYECESWTIKKAESWQIDAFELWCWRRLVILLDSKEMQPVYPKRNQSWIFIGRYSCWSWNFNTLAT